MVYTLMIVKEDDISLYGFHNKESLELFRMLITVNGVGAKAAMAIMGSMSADTLRRAILFEDVKEISKANGVGKKTAERLILELKDKLGKLEASANRAEGFSDEAISAAAEGMPDGRTEAINALIALGYTKAEAFAAVDDMMGDLKFGGCQGRRGGAFVRRLYQKGLEKFILILNRKQAQHTEDESKSEENRYGE